MDAERNEWRRRMDHWGERCVREEPLCELYSDHDNWQLWASDVIAWLDTIDAAKAREAKLEADLSKARRDRMETMKQLANAVSGRIFADEIERLRGELAAAEAERDLAKAALSRSGRVVEQLLGTLREVVDWIDNWDPSFTEDAAWPETAEKVRSLLNRGGES